jgi:hypothetical protein
MLAELVRAPAVYYITLIPPKTNGSITIGRWSSKAFRTSRSGVAAIVLKCIKHKIGYLTVTSQGLLSEAAPPANSSLSLSTRVRVLHLPKIP